MKSAQSLDRMSTALRTFYYFCPLFECYPYVNTFLKNPMADFVN